MKKLTVITVTYNARETLERTLESVGEQTYPYVEHLVVDGASHDGTVELVERYATAATVDAVKRDTEGERLETVDAVERDTQCEGLEAGGIIPKGKGLKKTLRWISEPDNGLYDAMNKGAAMASGDYLCFLNAGDTFYAPDTVEKMMQATEDGASPDILYGETAIVDNGGAFLHMRRLKAPDRLTWKSFKQGMVVCHQAFIVKRTLMEPYDLSYRFSSDFDWCIRMMKKASSIHNTGLVLINYLDEGVTTANRKASLKERYRIMARQYGGVSTFLHHLWFIVRAVLK